MVETERATEENPYHLSKEELTYSGARGRGWLKKLVAKQREGIDHGIRPQLPRDFPFDLMEKWRKRVWKYYVDQQPEEVRQAIMGTVDSEVEWSWRGREKEY